MSVKDHHGERWPVWLRAVIISGLSAMLWGLIIWATVRAALEISSQV